MDRRRRTARLWTSCAVPYDGRHGRPARRTAAFFDLDKTIIAKSSTLAFSKPFQAGGLISRRAVLRSAYAQFVYLVGGADHDQMEKMREFMSQLCAGWDVATVREIVADTLHNIVDPLVYDEAVSLIEEHRLAGRDVVIVSASGTEVVEPIGEMLGADLVVATRLEIVDGRYTGEIDYYAYAEEKAARSGARRAARLRPAASYAYSDSVTDVPMLEAVGHPHAVNPDRELRRVAARQRVAGAGVHQAGRAAQPGAAAARSRRWRRSRSAAPSPSAACSGPTPAAAASAPDRSRASPSPTLRGFETGAERPPQPPLRARPHVNPAKPLHVQVAPKV